MADWKEYSIYINEDAEDSVSEILMEAGSTGVSIVSRIDFEAMPEADSNLLWELDEKKFPKEGIIVKAYFDLEDITANFHQNLHEKLDALKDLDLGVEDYTVETASIKNEDWENNWKEYYHPVPVTRYLTIVPEWEDYESTTSEEQLIVMDPGLAFGTGTHPTTQLSIQALETVMRGGEVIADVGTGSGVLTIASSLLGASEVYAYDLDEMAVGSARSNIELNDLSAKIQVEENNLLEGVDLEVDIVVANILTHILIQLLPDAMRVLNDGGYFITSGIIVDKKEEMIKALEKEGFEIQQLNQMKDWLGIIARKPFAQESENTI